MKMLWDFHGGGRKKYKKSWDEEWDLLEVKNGICQKNDGFHKMAIKRILQDIHNVIDD